MQFLYIRSMRLVVRFCRHPRFPFGGTTGELNFNSSSDSDESPSETTTSTAVDFVVQRLFVALAVVGAEDNDDALHEGQVAEVLIVAVHVVVVVNAELENTANAELVEIVFPERLLVMVERMPPLIALITLMRLTAAGGWLVPENLPVVAVVLVLVAVLLLRFVEFLPAGVLAVLAGVVEYSLEFYFLEGRGVPLVPRGEQVSGSLTFGEDPRIEVVPAEKAGGTLTEEQRKFRDAWLTASKR